jgi:hypothetical protein
MTRGTEPGAAAWDPRAVWARQVTAHRALERVTRTFEEAGIETLAVKGVVTSCSLYEDPTERPMGDVDLRIRPEDFERAAGVARRAGWRIGDWKPTYKAFVIDMDGLGVDVESFIGAPGFCALSIAEMLSRATRGCGGADARVPELHDHAVLLCVNVFKDKFALAFPWSLEDVRRIVELEAFDEDRFIEGARRARITCIAWIVADWMKREKESAAWARVKAKLGGERAPRPLYAWAFRRLQERAPESLATRLLARAGPDDVGMRVAGLVTAATFEVGTYVGGRESLGR